MATKGAITPSPSLIPYVKLFLSEARHSVGSVRCDPILGSPKVFINCYCVQTSSGAAIIYQTRSRATRGVGGSVTNPRRGPGLREHGGRDVGGDWKIFHLLQSPIAGNILHNVRNYLKCRFAC